MSRIDDLIARLCPAGVESRAIEACVGRPQGIKWSECLGEQFQYIDLTSVDRVTHTIVGTATITSDTAPSRAQQVLRAGDVIFGTTRPTLQRYAVVPPDYDGQICSTGFCVLRPDTRAVLTNYLFHLLGTDDFHEYVKRNERGASYPAISDTLVKRYRIPVPPLEVQREIVNVLDRFTELELDLEAELEARRRQYEHYRNALLARSEEENARLITLGDAFMMRAGQHVSATQISDVRDADTPYACYGGNGIRGYVSARSHAGDYLLIGRQGALCGNVRRVRGEFYATEHAVVVTPGPVVDLDWAFHMLTFMDLNQYATKSAQPGLAVGKLANIAIAVPPIEEQQRIAEALDGIDALVSDHSIGLPAELNARRKQYKYYRDRLLNFSEAA